MTGRCVCVCVCVRVHMRTHMCVVCCARMCVPVCTCVFVMLVNGKRDIGALQLSKLLLPEPLQQLKWYNLFSQQQLNRWLRASHSGVACACLLSQQTPTAADVSFKSAAATG